MAVQCSNAASQMSNLWSLLLHPHRHCSQLSSQVTIKAQECHKQWQQQITFDRVLLQVATCMVWTPKTEVQPQYPMRLNLQWNFVMSHAGPKKEWLVNLSPSKLAWMLATLEFHDADIAKEIGQYWRKWADLELNLFVYITNHDTFDECLIWKYENKKEKWTTWWRTCS